uniref:Glutaredoxin-1 n=1 Tax=Strix occidentalis caurina TaxID=311401 RepID=A0A8D0FJE3_STROC
MAEAFVKSKLRDDKVTLFVKDGCPYCRNAMEMLKQYNFRPECLQVCDITGMQSVQEYFRQTTGQNTVSPRSRGSDPLSQLPRNLASCCRA